jgi:uncharacterized protein YceK
MKKYFFIFICVGLFLSGCAGIRISRHAKYTGPEFPAVAVKVDEDVTGWWGSLKRGFLDRVVQGVKDEIDKTPAIIVVHNPDITLVIKDVVTRGYKEEIQIEKVTVSVRSRKGEIFKVFYKQKPSKIPDDLLRFWEYAKEPESIGTVIARSVLKEIGVGWSK